MAGALLQFMKTGNPNGAGLPRLAKVLTARAKPWSSTMSV